MTDASVATARVTPMPVVNAALAQPAPAVAIDCKIDTLH